VERQLHNIDIRLASPRALAAISDALDLSVETVVCLPTFRRPEHLRLTLESLLSQRTAHRFAVVIVENDATANEGARVAAQFLTGGGLQGLCIVEPRQGNCQAINAAFETAQQAFPNALHFLMIDDDEIASPDWLGQMVDAAGTTGAEVIGGPVWPVFVDTMKQNLERHPAFRPAYETSGPVPVIYGSGNCLITRPVFARDHSDCAILRWM
jgi:glycosyltransferase involved in cell wall biosynthesis